MSHIKKSFTFAGLLTIAGCGDPPPTPYESKVTQENSDFTVETIQSGDFLTTLPDGLHKLTISGEVLNQESDMTCIVIKNAQFEGNPAATGFAGLSCDFDVK